MDPASLLLYLPHPIRFLQAMAIQAPFPFRWPYHLQHSLLHFKEEGRLAALEHRVEEVLTLLWFCWLKLAELELLLIRNYLNLLFLAIIKEAASFGCGIGRGWAFCNEFWATFSFFFHLHHRLSALYHSCKTLCEWYSSISRELEALIPCNRSSL